VANIPDGRSPDFTKILFWSTVLVIVFITIIVLVLSYYYRPTFERVQ
jgi:hypothetical protein